LLTSAGIVGIIIGISAQAPLSNIIAGIILLADRPFEPGDYISIQTLRGVQTGKVLTMGFRSTRLKSFDENIIIIPNSVISSNTVVNLSAEDKHLRASAVFAVDTDRVAESLKRLEMIGTHYDRDGAPELLVRKVSSSTTTLELRVLIPGVESRDEIISQINKQYLSGLDKL
jgi:small-conductance mechanosensitive channel